MEYIKYLVLWVIWLMKHFSVLVYLINSKDNFDKWDFLNMEQIHLWIQTWKHYNALPFCSSTWCHSFWWSFTQRMKLQMRIRSEFLQHFYTHICFMKTCNHDLSLRGFWEVPESKILKLYNSYTFYAKELTKKFYCKKSISQTRTNNIYSKQYIENVLVCNVQIYFTTQGSLM